MLFRYVSQDLSSLTNRSDINYKQINIKGSSGWRMLVDQEIYIQDI